jgi:hypothetical protein
MLYFRNEEIHELPENEKRAIDQPFSHFVIFQFFCILSRKTPNYHRNSYTNTKTPSHFRVFIISSVFNSIFRQPNTLFAKTANTLHPFTSPLYTITETPTFA